MKKLFYFLLLLPAVVLASCNDDDDNPYKVNLSEGIKTYITTNYPGAIIKGSEWTANGLIEVDVVHDSKDKDVYFTKDEVWVRTDWDLPKTSLPQAAKENISVEYPKYSVDDVDYVQTPDGDYYKVEIEKGNIEKHLKVSLDGALVEEL